MTTLTDTDRPSGAHARTRPAVRPRRRRPPLSPLALVGVGAIAAYVATLTAVSERYSYDYWGPLVIGPALVALSLPIVRRLARAETDERVARLLTIALYVKLFMSLARYAVTQLLYKGVGDAHSYHQIGAQLSVVFRHGSFSGWQGPFPGTGFIEILTGLVYSITGPTELGGYMVFAWMGYWGQVLFFRAFRLAVPDGDRLSYARLVLLLPSLLFWPSSIGKEAWMMLTLGLTAYGAVRLLAGLRNGLVLTLVGLTGAALPRPHLALIVGAGLLVATLVRRPAREKPGAALRKWIIVAVMLGATMVALGQTQKFFKADNLSAPGAAQANGLDLAAQRTAKGNSKFTATAVNSPLDLPTATLTVLFRPYPWEAHSVQDLTTAAEGGVLLGLFVARRRRVVAAFRKLRDRPYLAYALTFILLFVFAFSRFANFGVLARERVQVLPLVLVLLAMPAVPAERIRRRRGTNRSTATRPVRRYR